MPYPRPSHEETGSWVLCPESLNLGGLSPAYESARSAPRRGSEGWGDHLPVSVGCSPLRGEAKASRLEVAARDREAGLAELASTERMSS
jgi:hypothetical protein